MKKDLFDYLEQTHQETLENQRQFVSEYKDQIAAAAEALGDCVNGGNKALIFGNGGSAADSQHMAAEMVGKMLVPRRPLAAIALTTDTSNLTAVGNDFGFEDVFALQVEALGQPGDLCIAISTSGNSKNVLKAVQVAKKKSMKVIALTGGGGGELKGMADISLNVDLGKNSSRIQETHIFAIHSMVDLMDRFFLKS